ncbi:hypothetical protein MMINT_00440 [Candidatus Methanomassiliicoccus intestinalis Issoire-Mx1]|jgi:hypothetical protein|uniref:GPR1/FUN34/yaaH family protein n=2 Tax=Candidatus Methanomassiliicoccus intestinalis TaxID=1406512 RepID=R9T409_METII|nr:GPR1/FUN34/YaaH family transporter [Candidatus Methanomassiliicoccus intestinalis]AGN25460.1 hypothetical protein MMINT_00440 [Candidatus Methanomassiliicoccus intestinalis Issoire-Mx1]
MADNNNMPTRVLANPAPLGLLGFGMTTVLLSFHNLGMFPMDMTILALGVFYGGLAQLIAGVMEYKNENTFGATAFTSYGFFWMAFVLVVLNPFGEADTTAGGMFFLLWGILTLFLFIGTLRSDMSMKIIFGTLTALFFIIAAGNFTGSEIIPIMSGALGIICGGSAMYRAFGEVINEQYQREVLPL